jgi:hypothetical protein
MMSGLSVWEIGAPRWPSPGPCANAGSNDRSGDLAADRGGALRQTARSDDRPAGRKRRCAESRVRRVHSDAAPGDAVSRSASRWSGGGVGRLADRCARVWDLRDAAFCEDDTPRPGGGAQRYVGAWSNGQTEGQINRLKTLKRAMYGRAGVELLRARMMPL